MLANPKINIKLKLSALWATLLSLYIYGDYFELYTPEKIEKLIEGTSLLDSPTKLFMAAFMLAIPAFMISLSIFLKPKVNRWLNIVVASFLTIVVILVGSSALHAWHSFYVFYAVLEAAVTVLIVWHAWHWPKES